VAGVDDLIAGATELGEVVEHWGWFVDPISPNTDVLLLLTDRYLRALATTSRLRLHSERSMRREAIASVQTGRVPFPSLRGRRGLFDRLEIVVPGAAPHVLGQLSTGPRPWVYISGTEGDPAARKLIAAVEQLAVNRIQPAHHVETTSAPNPNDLYCGRCGLPLDLATRACRSCGIDTEPPAPAPPAQSNPTATPASGTPNPGRKLGCLWWVLILLVGGVGGGLALAAVIESSDECAVKLVKDAQARGVFLSVDEARADCGDTESNPLPDQQLYSIPYQICAADPNSVYAQAQTLIPEDAARWYASGLTGEGVAPGYDGCLAGLTGAPNKYSAPVP
jgi:hypothetical protein